MASGQTENYGLNQWAGTDKFLRTEFNEDNAKIDAALGKMPKVAAGVYVGNGTGNRTTGANVSQTISVGFQPKAVLVVGGQGCGFGEDSSLGYAQLILANRPYTYSYNQKIYTLARITDNGFTVGSLYTGVWLHPCLNESSVQYYYVAIG